MLIGDYNNYTFFIEGEKPLFNKEAFIESHKEKEFKYFLSQLIKTKLFEEFLENEKKIYFMKKIIKKENETNEIQNDVSINNKKYYDTSFFKKISYDFPDLINNYQIKKNSDSISSIMKKDTYFKAKTICAKFKIINESNKSDLNNLNKKEKSNDYDTKNTQMENSQINKKKTNVLFSGKNYLEDIPEEKNIDVDIKEFSTHKRSKNSEINSFDYKSINKSGLKESKISTEVTTLNSQFNFINKNEIKEEKEENDEQKIIYININSNKKLFSNDKKDESKQNIKKYLLVPFLDDDVYIKEKITEDIIINEMKLYRKRKNIKDKIPPFSLLITFISKYINYNSYNIKKSKIYYINDNYIIKSDRNECDNKIKNYLKDSTKEVISFKKKYFKEEISEGDIIDINNIYEKGEETILINRFFKSCFVNKLKIDSQNLILIKKLFSNIENREFFANLIVPDMSLKNRCNHKQLTIYSFNIFSQIIKLSFENLNQNDNNLGRLLTLACFIYYKIEKDKQIYIYKDFIINNSSNQQINSQPYQLWNTDSFWIEFFNSEFECNIREKEDEENEEEIYENNENEDNKTSDKLNNNINKNENESINYRKKMCLFKTVIGVSGIMCKLNLEKNFIINIIEKMILPVFINDFLYINRIMKLALIANNAN